jgi:hypothetical protein
MFLLFFPFGAIFGDTYDGWVFHFLAVIVFDILSIGEIINIVIIRVKINVKIKH